MRVFIVSANREQRPDPVVPLGASYVAGAARAAGHDVAFHDCCFDADGDLQALAASVERARPEVIGLAMRNVDDVAWPNAHGWLAEYRAIMGILRRAGVPVVLGGAGFSLFPGPWLDALGADYGIVGEGERAFVDVLAALARDEAVPRITRSLSRPPDPTIEPAFDLVDLERYFRLGGGANVQTRRGWPSRRRDFVPCTKRAFDAVSSGRAQRLPRRARHVNRCHEHA